MTFCANCGAKLADGAKFCPECGTKVGAAGDSASLTQGEQVTRNTTFAGGILKCPNCGSVVDKLATVCPSCGFKLEGGVSNSVKSLLAKLDEIESQRKIDTKHEANALYAIGKAYTNVFTMGNDPILNKEVEAINHFPIPTSITEMTELFLVALPRIDTTVSKNSFLNRQNKLTRNRFGGDSASKLSDAWLTLLQGAYAKASMTFANEPEFAKLDEMYKSKMKELGIKTNVLGGLAKEPKKRKHGCLTAILIVVGIMILLNVIGFIFLKSDSLDSINNFSNEMINKIAPSLENQNLKTSE